MIAAESSTVRSVNSGVIAGVVTRMITKPKKPISAAVMAPMAAIRVGPSALMKSTKPCTVDPRLFCRIGVAGAFRRPGKFCRVCSC